MKNLKLTVFIFSILVALTLFWRNPPEVGSASPPKEIDYQNTISIVAKRESSTAPQIPVSMPSKKANLMTDESVQFFSDIDNALDSSTAFEMFEKTGLDSSTNFLKAKASLLAPLNTLSIDKDRVRDRVLSLEFLKYSKHLSWGDCDEILQGFASSTHKNLTELQSLNLKMDILSISRSCMRRFSTDRVETFFQNASVNDNFKAQVALAFLPEGIQK